MTIPASRIVGPDPGTLFGLFGPADDCPAFDVVPAPKVPEPYHTLLVHPHHMTVTVEAHHGDRVNVRILSRRHHGDVYARKILLTLRGSGRVVQFGIVRVHLQYCPPAAREEILAGQKPFGRILIEHDVLRRIEPTAFLRVTPNTAMTQWFGLDRPRVTYGRSAYIHCNDQRAVELLEIVTPEPPA